MSDVSKMQREVELARSELKNIRQELWKHKAKLKEYVSEIKVCLHAEAATNKCVDGSTKILDKIRYNMNAIGTISSCFKTKNGIPRQPSLCPSAKATVKIEKSVFTNPQHSLIGLQEFSYIWILFVFHKNEMVENFAKAKVHPPRLNGSSVGVFATRSPHRPNAIGLSLTKLEKIEGSTLHLSGVDLLDGTPVLDIKPYIPAYDIPIGTAEKHFLASKSNPEINNLAHDTEKENESNTNLYESQLINFKYDYKDITENSQHTSFPIRCGNVNQETSEVNILDIGSKKMYGNIVECNTAAWLQESPVSNLKVSFTNRALKDLEKFHHFKKHKHKCEFCLDFIDGSSQATTVITEILNNDPRSVFRRKRCSDKLYYFPIDNMHITCWFDNTLAEVLKIQPSGMVTGKL